MPDYYVIYLSMLRLSHAAARQCTLLSVLTATFKIPAQLQVCQMTTSNDTIHSSKQVFTDISLIVILSLIGFSTALQPSQGSLSTPEPS
jgi:hypothetical protein